MVACRGSFPRGFPFVLIGKLYEKIGSRSVVLLERQTKIALKEIEDATTCGCWLAFGGSWHRRLGNPKYHVFHYGARGGRRLLENRSFKAPHDCVQSDCGCRRINHRN